MANPTADELMRAFTSSRQNGGRKWLMALFLVLAAGWFGWVSYEVVELKTNTIDVDRATKLLFQSASIEHSWETEKGKRSVITFRKLGESVSDWRGRHDAFVMVEQGRFPPAKR